MKTGIFIFSNKINKNNLKLTLYFFFKNYNSIYKHDIYILYDDLDDNDMIEIKSSIRYDFKNLINFKKINLFIPDNINNDKLTEIMNIEFEDWGTIYERKLNNFWLFDFWEKIAIDFDYILKSDRSNPLKGATGTISDYSNVPYENVTYKDVNSVGRQWIRRYTLALAKEMLGYIRGKYSSLPIPNAEITLNGSDLIGAAQTEKEGLITELKEILDTMSRQAQLERKEAESNSLQSQFNKMPMKIYIG